jgi:peptidase C39-like protein
MNHRHLRTPFRHAKPRRSRRLPVISAAAVGVASVLALSLNQSVGAASAGHTHESTVLDLSGAQAVLGGQALAGAKSKAAASKAGGQSAAPAASATPAASASPTPPPSEKELGYQFQLQPNFYYCGPAATRIAASTLGMTPSQDDLAAMLGTTVNGTNSAFDIARVLNAINGTSYYHATSIPGQAATPAEMDQLQADVVRAVSNGRAVVMNIVGTGWDVDGVPHAYDGGHYLTVVGYKDDGRTVKIADPANVVGDGSYWMTTINLANWSATRGYAS